MSKVTVQRQNWQRWPRVLIAEKHNDDGTVDERRYVPEGGKLTAEQVRELIAPHLNARPTFDFGRHGAVWSADFHAIADELNAVPLKRDRAMEVNDE